MQKASDTYDGQDEVDAALSELQEASLVSACETSKTESYVEIHALTSETCVRLINMPLDQAQFHIQRGLFRRAISAAEDGELIPYAPHVSHLLRTAEADHLSITLALSFATNVTAPEELQRYALDNGQRKLGPSHPYTLVALNNLADTFISRRNGAAAREVDTQLLESVEAAMGQGSSIAFEVIFEALLNLASSLKYAWLQGEADNQA